ncbi:MAG: glycoside hydrolase family 2 TIM barrel-domain containing protein, partial [Eubacteriales bacterium]|nr:glycoside hydrolase family 2 TIM barrel-domain containing protein [Eubacteriales bacterium]
METTRFCLDRGWRFTLSEQSVLPARINHETVYSFAKGDGAQGPAAANFRDDGWEAVDLPHDWQHLQPFDPSGVSSHGYQATGVGWYRRTFSLAPEDESGEVLLEFEGISGISDIYFNGAKLLHNESCYNGFTLSLTDLANFGAAPNVLCVRVDKTVWEGWWYEGCGINRHVWLLKKPRLRIAPDGVWVRPERVNGQWRVRCEWTLENGADKAARGTVNGRVLAPDGREMQRLTVPVEVAAYDRAAAHAEWTVENPVLWDLDSPLRYTLETSVVSEYGCDTERTRFGLRTLRVDADTGFWLNDRRVKLLGTCNHQDHAGIGAAIPADLWRWRVQRLKDMGSNAYRCSHNPPPKALLEACDELGMLVMDENRAYSTSPDALALLESMVRRDRNHPCVVMYSLFNEEPMQGSPKGQRLAKRQMAALKRLDDTRPVLGAMNGGIFEEKGASPVLDVTGINYFIDSFDRFHALYPDRPFVSSETCSAFATRGCAETDERRQEFDGRDTACAA